MARKTKLLLTVAAFLFFLAACAGNARDPEKKNDPGQGGAMTQQSTGTDAQNQGAPSQDASEQLNTDVTVQPVETVVKAGAYFWHGWYGQGRTYARLETEFAEREPIWGWYNNSVENMEVQINEAASHGIKFFAFCWYYPEGTNKYTPMNDCIDLYLKASNRDLMEFCLVVANHEGYRIYETDWEACVDQWIPLLKHENYVKADGKPLLIFFTSLYQDMKSSAAVKRCLDRLQERAKAEGLPGVSVAVCDQVYNKNDAQRLYTRAEEGYTHATGYNYHNIGGMGAGLTKIRPFSALREDHLKIWNAFADYSPLQYIPVVTAGWDKRAWEDPLEQPQSVYYPDRTPIQVAQFVQDAVSWIQRNPDKATKEKLMIIYAWNEFGEGGYIAPTKGDDGRYLDMIMNVLKK